MFFPTIRARRKLGITFRNIRRTMLAMKAADADALAEVPAVIAAEVLGRLIAEHPEAFRDPGIDWENIDWDAIMAFIEWVVQLVLTIIALFP